MSNSNEESFAQLWAQRDPKKRSTFNGGSRVPLQIIIASTVEAAMKCATVLGAPMANSLESLFRLHGIQLLPPNGQNRSGYERRLSEITELLKEGQSGVFVGATDRGEDESFGDLMRRYNWPDKLLFLPDEIWTCRSGIAHPLRVQDGSRQPFDYTHAQLIQGSGHAKPN